MMPPPRLQIYLRPRPRLTLSFDLLTPKVDRLMSLSRGPLEPISIKIGSFFFKYRVHKSGNGRTDGLTEGRTDW